MVTDRDLYAQTICTLVEYYGYTDVALMLNVPMADLQRWCSGKSRPPTDVFLRIIDLSREVDA